jgi:hypothetical protein
MVYLFVVVVVCAQKLIRPYNTTHKISWSRSLEFCEERWWAKQGRKKARRKKRT